MDVFVGALIQGASSERAGNALLCVVVVIGVALVAAIRYWGK